MQVMILIITISFFYGVIVKALTENWKIGYLSGFLIFILLLFLYLLEIKRKK